MINPLLHREPVVVDSTLHRATKLRLPVTDWSVARQMNAVFVAAAEFSDASRDFPLVFVRAGDAEDGKPAIAPIAVLSLVQGDNLFVEGGAWRATYIPAVLAVYPFAAGRINAERFAVCLDASWSGASSSEGEPLFDAQGQPSALLQRAQAQLEQLEAAVQTTQHMGRRLLELDLLRDMRFDATLPDGKKFAVDGFLTVDTAKLAALPDAAVVELHRSGLLGLVHAHLGSLGHMRKLLDWHVRRLAQSAG
jgi:hypothetical protein